MRKGLWFVGVLAVAGAMALVPFARQASGFTLVERSHQGVPQSTLLFSTVVAIDQVLMCDGSHTLAPGRYDVQVFSLGDGSVRAFFSQGGLRKGTATGKLERGALTVTGKQTGVGGAAQVNAQQVHFQKTGQHAFLEFGVPGQDRVLIGLLLPAVQRGITDGTSKDPAMMKGSQVQIKGEVPLVTPH